MLEPYGIRVAGAICGRAMPRIRGDQALFANWTPDRVGIDEIWSSKGTLWNL